MKHRFRRLLLTAFALPLLAGLAFGVFGPAKQADAAINKRINFQGRLADSAGNAVFDGTYNVEFKFHSSSGGSGGGQGTCSGDCLWMETRTGGNKVTVSRGLFSVQLGEVTSLSSFNFNQDLYLSVRVGGTGTPSWDTEMTPRHRLGAAPTAIFADDAGTVQGYAPGNGSGALAVNNGTLNTNLNADLLDGQSGSYYQNAANLTGTLADARLSANVALLNGTGPQTFTGNNKFTGTLNVQKDSATAFFVQNQNGDTVFNISTNTNTASLPYGNISLTGLPGPTNVNVATSGTGGTLPAGPYWYYLTASGPGGESIAVYTNPFPATTTGTTSKNTITWTASAGATGYKLYRDNGAGGFKVESLGNVTSAVDDGSNFTWTTAGTPPYYAPTTGTVSAAGYYGQNNTLTIGVTPGGFPVLRAYDEVGFESLDLRLANDTVVFYADAGTTDLYGPANAQLVHATENQTTLSVNGNDLLTAYNDPDSDFFETTLYRGGAEQLLHADGSALELYGPGGNDLLIADEITTTLKAGGIGVFQADDTDLRLFEPSSGGNDVFIASGTNTKLLFDGSEIFNSDATTTTISADSVDVVVLDANQANFARSITAGAAATGTTGTTSGTGTNTTTVTLAAAGSFANNDVIFIDNAGQDYYTRIVSGGGTTTLTVSPAVTFETGRTITKYTVQNIGATATDYASNSLRFFEGKFLGQLTVGAGTTQLSDGMLVFQGDTNLYRSAANTLRTNADFFSNGYFVGVEDSATSPTSGAYLQQNGMVQALPSNSAANDFISLNVQRYNDSQSTWNVTADGTINWGPGGSTATDTNLYRSAANTLKTDDSLHSNTNSTTALLVEQDGVKDNVLVVDTTNGMVGVNVQPSTSGSAFQVTGGVQAKQTSTATWASGLAGTIVYDTTDGNFYLYDGVAKKELCNVTDAGCGSGGAVTLQDAYNNSSAPATITTASNKNILFTLAEAATDSSFVVNLACTSCGANTGRFAIQDGGTDVFRIEPNGTAWFRSSTDNTAAFQIQDQDTNPLIAADTSNMKVGINVAPSSGGAALQVAGDLDITGVYKVSGSQIASSNLSDSSNIAKLNAANTFTNTNTINKDSTTAFKVEQASNNTLVVDTTNAKIGVGQAPTSSGDALQISGSASLTARLLLNTSADNAGRIDKSAQATAATGWSANDVVVAVTDSGNYRVTTTTTGKDRRVYGVAVGTVAAGGFGSVTIAGNATVNIATGASVNIGDQLVTGTSAGKVVVDNSATTGILGYATSNKTAGVGSTVNVQVRPVAGQTSPTFDNGLNIASAQTYKVNGTQISSADLSNDANLAKLDASNTFTGTTNTFDNNVVLGSSSADAITVNGVLNGPSNIIQLAAGNTTLRRTAAGTYTLELNDTSATTYSIQNTDGTAKASLTVEGDISIGSGQLYKINGTQITSAALSNDANLAKIDGANVFTNANKINTNSTTALFVEQDGVNDNTLVVDTTNQKIGVGMAPSSALGSILQVTGGIATTGSVYLNESAAPTTAGRIEKGFTAGTGGVSTGDAVILLSESGNLRYNTTTTARDIRVIGVAALTTSAGSQGRVAISGAVSVKIATAAAVSIGDQLVTSTVAGEAMVDNNATTGIIGHAIAAKTGGVGSTVAVMVQPVTGQTNPTFENNVTLGDATSDSVTLNGSLNGASNILQLAAANTTLQRTAAGTYTISLNDTSATTLNVTNSDGTAKASLTVEGDISIGSGQLYKINGTQITSAALSNDSDLAKLAASSQTFTGKNTFSRNGTGTGDYTLAVTGTPVANATSSQVRIGDAIAGGDASTNGGTYLGLNAPSTGAGSAADLMNLQYNGTAVHRVNSFGDQTTVGRQLDGSGNASPAGTSSTSMTLSGTSPTTTNFDVGNYIKIASTNCGGTGVSTCYAKVTAKTATVLTITPALTWANNTTVNEYHMPEIGGIDLTQSVDNRYGRGYFIAGVATGNGTTYYNEDGVQSSVSTYTVDLNNSSASTYQLTNSNGSAKLSLDVEGDVNIGSGQLFKIGGTQISTSNLSDAANIAFTNTAPTFASGVNISSGQTYKINGTQITSAALSNDANLAKIDGTTAFTNGLNIASGQTYKINGTQISSAALSNDANLAKLDGTGPQTFTGNNKFTGTVLFQNASNSTGAFTVQSSGGSTTLLNVDTTNNKINIAGSMATIGAINSGSAPTFADAGNTGGTLSGSAATTYYYKVTAITPTGETAPTAQGSFNGGSFTAISAPGAPTVAAGAAGVLSGVYRYKITFVTANGETTGGTTATTASLTSKQVDLSNIPTGPTGTLARRIYRTASGGADTTQKFIHEISNNTATTYTDNEADSGLRDAYPATNTARLNTNQVTITYGSVTGATSYRIYRGTTSGVFDTYQTDAASPFTDAGAAGTAGTLPGAFTVQNGSGANVLSVDTATSKVQLGQLPSCDQLFTDLAGNVTCGTGIQDQINKITIYGSSLTTGYGASNVNYRYTNRLATMLHAIEDNRGQNGGVLGFNENGVSGDGGYAKILQGITNTRTAAPYLANPGINILHYGINDLGNYVVEGDYEAFNNSMRTAISRTRAGAVFEETNATRTTFTGTWSDQTTYSGSFSGVGYKQSSTNGNTYTINVPADFPGGTVAVGIITTKDGNGGTHTWTVDGGAAGSYNTINKGARSDRKTGYVKRFTGLSAGAHTIVGTLSAITGSTNVDYWQIEASPAPMTVLPKVYSPVDFSGFVNTTSVPNDTGVKLMNDQIVSVAAEFDTNVITVDLNAALNKDAKYFFDGTHPNDLGEAVIANQVYQAIRKAPMTAEQQAYVSGQVADTRNNQQFKNTTDSTTAFQIQNSTGSTVLNIDTTNKRVGIGTAAPSYALDIQGSSADTVLNVQSGNNANYAAVMTGRSSGLESVFGTAAATDQFLTGSAAGDTIIKANGGKLVMGSTASGGVVVRNTVATATAFQVQNTSGTALFSVDTNSGIAVKIGSGLTANGSGIDLIANDAEFQGLLRVGGLNDYVSFDGSTHEPTLNGAARHTRSVDMNPEYENAVISGDGSSNSGTMTSDFCSGSSNLNVNATACGATEDFNFYQWKSGAASANDYDIYIRYRMPQDFTGFADANTIKLFGWRSTSAEKVELALFEGSAQCGSTTEINSSNTTWQEASMTGDETSLTNCTNIVAGDMVTFRIRLTSAATTQFARASRLTFSYKSKW